MTDHIGEANQKVIDLDALEKLADEAEESGGDWECSSEAGSAFIAAVNPATIKALIAELKEARGLLEEVEPLTICWATHYASARGFEQHPQHKALNANIRAFLARNGEPK